MWSMIVFRCLILLENPGYPRNLLEFFSPGNPGIILEFCQVSWKFYGAVAFMHGERDNARNNARCSQVRNTTHGLDGHHQYVDRTVRGRVNQNDRVQRQTEKVRPWYLRSRMTKEQNRTDGFCCNSYDATMFTMVG